MEWLVTIGVILVMTIVLWYVLRAHARETKQLLEAMEAVRRAMLEHSGHLLARIETVERHMVTFITKITEDAASVLHQPHDYAKDMDRLLEEFFANEIPPERLADLKQRLRQKILDPLEERPKEDVRQRQKAASMLLRAIEQQQEAATGEKPANQAIDH